MKGTRGIGRRRGGSRPRPHADAGSHGLRVVLLFAVAVLVAATAACTSDPEEPDPPPQTTGEIAEPSPADVPIDVEVPATPSATADRDVPSDPDLGRTWSRVPHDEDVFGAGRMTAVTTGGPGLVAVGVDDARGTPAVWASPDGIVWERRAEGDAAFEVAGILEAVVVGGPGLVAVGQDAVLDAAAVWTSTDGLAWQRVAHDEAALGGPGRQVMRAITVTDRGLVAVGQDVGTDTAAVWTSADGLRWERTVPDPPGGYDGSMTAVVEADGGLVAVGQFDGIGAVWTSTDARTWTLAASGDELGDTVLHDVVGTDAGMFAVGADLYDGAAIATSPDGRRWSRVAHGEAVTDTRSWMTGVTLAGPGLVAIGGEMPGDESGSPRAASWTSTDGASWQRVELAEDVFGTGAELAALTPGGPGLVVVGTDLVRDRPAVWVSPADPYLPAPVDPVPMRIDLDTLRPEQLTSPAHVCLDVRDAPRWVEGSGGDFGDGEPFAWSFSEQLDPVPPDANMLGYSLAFLGKADVTGDGREELVVYAVCTSGAGGSPHAIAVYTPDVGGPRLLDVLHDGVNGAAYGDWLVDLDLRPGEIRGVHGTAGFDSSSDTVLMTRVRYRWDAGLGAFVEEPIDAPILVAREAFHRVPLAPGWPGDGPVPDGSSLPGGAEPATEGELSAFMTPSTNIACEYHSSAIGCVVRSGLSPPPRGSCAGETVVFLRFDEPPGLACWEDGPFPGSEPLAVLEYGHSWQIDDLGLSCASQETGLTCTNALGNGFFLSRAHWETW